MTTVNEDKAKRLKANNLRFKGELIDEEFGKELDPSMGYTKDNPTKTPPNNITNKERAKYKG